jgi:four helix bundle protein
MGDFRKLEVWRKAHALALSTHRSTGNLRGSEFAGLRNQIVRAAMSVPTNIVEGNEKRSDKDFARFLRIALGSLTELEYHLLIGNDLRAIPNSEFNSLLGQLVDVRKMLCGLIRKLDTVKQKTTTPPSPAA